MSNNTIYGAAVVMIKDKDVYLCRRTEKVIFPKKWQFINGRIQHTEQSMDTAVRILEEHAMLKIDKKRLHFLQNVTIEESNEFYYIYVINLKEGEVPMNTCNRWRDNWKLFPMAKAGVLDVVPGIRGVIRTLERTRRTVFEAPAPVQVMGPPAPPIQPQQQQQQRTSEEHIRQQLSHGEQLSLDNMQAKMTRHLDIRHGYVPF